MGAPTQANRMHVSSRWNSTAQMVRDGWLACQRRTPDGPSKQQLEPRTYTSSL